MRLCNHYMHTARHLPSTSTTTRHQVTRSSLHQVIQPQLHLSHRCDLAHVVPDSLRVHPGPVVDAIGLVNLHPDPLEDGGYCKTPKLRVRSNTGTEADRQDT